MWAHVYALDIETDTAPRADGRARGLDPQLGGITSVALAHARGTEVFTCTPETSDEAHTLARLNQWLRQAPPGLLVTWNGSMFDLPFLADRARLLGIQPGPHLEPEPTLIPKYAPLAGHTSGYSAMWPTGCGVGHAHLDLAYYAQRALGLSGEDWGLKPLARTYGLEPVEVERTAMHELDEEALRAYVASDAEITRTLAQRLLPGLGTH